MKKERQNRFSRLELLIGSEGLSRLKYSHVAVIGLGGVGSYAAEALARSGIGTLTLVDFDDVCLTNTNRQIHALEGNYGRPKVEVMAERVRAINPEAVVFPKKEFIGRENAATVVPDGIDYVVDAIDTISSKVDLLCYCMEKRIPVISAMGTGNKFDPLAFRVADISKTHTCPLAKAVRKCLRDRGIDRGIKVVFSIERPVEPKEDVPTCRQACICPRPDEQEWNCARRRQIPGSTSFVPPVAGLIMAGEVIKELLRK